MRLARKLGLGLMAMATLVAPAAAQGQYPSQIVRIVVPFGAGSQTDQLARVFADKLATLWKEQVIVENKPGIGGTASVAKAAPDGHTIMLTGNGHTIIGALNRSLNFDPVKDFAAITKVAVVPGIIVVPADGPNTLQELIARAKADPGKLNYASAGLGSVSSTGMELLKSAAGINLVHVPFPGLAGSHTATIRGDTQVTLTFYSAAGDLVDSGKLKPLAVTPRKRLAMLPNVPTVAEAGVPDYEYDPWFGMLAPAGTPVAIVEKLARDIGAIGKSADVADRFAKLGALIETTTPAEFDAIIKQDGARFSKLFAAPAQ
jgi:tripartite-type tricarboxylate transporter receptor subunit TctC